MSDYQEGFVLGVLGASGGVGATALATACAVRAAAAGREAVLVDGHPWGGGIEVMAGVDAVPGLRWADLAGVRGDIEPDRLLAGLPTRQPGFRCLSWGSRPPTGDPPGPSPIVPALCRDGRLVVVDLPRPAARSHHEQWWQSCDQILVVVDASVVGISAAAVLAQDLSPGWGVVLRAPSTLDDADLMTAVGAPVLTRLGDDDIVSRCLERGDPVGSHHGAVCDAADELLAVVLPAVRAA
ncbi:MAG TPA: hypothetical protein VK045_07150 [Ornithinicoccus sp.]|nr:hypothetical protein [Ornithinicoccus sp.]